MEKWWPKLPAAMAAAIPAVAPSAFTSPIRAGLSPDGATLAYHSTHAPGGIDTVPAASTVRLTSTGDYESAPGLFARRRDPRVPLQLERIGTNAVPVAGPRWADHPPRASAAPQALPLRRESAGSRSRCGARQAGDDPPRIDIH
jgi:hypothetical protein